MIRVVQCAGHVNPAVKHYTPDYTEPHRLHIQQLTRLAELLSDGDWEDGPRCLLDVLKHDRETRA